MSFGSILYTILISPLQLFFEVVFGFAFKYTNNPGVSIILLSLAMNFLVLPLYKRADAMQAEERDTEAKLHDGLAHIKKTFSGDERMMMQQEYYRQNHYKTTDAFKGSVSLFLEIPFFIAAYQFLSNMQALQNVSFGPIINLGAQDQMLTIAGVSINLLPILMTGINLISCIIYTKGYPLKTKVQLYAMAAFFFFFLYDSPAGLLFYWTLNNLFSLVKNIFYKFKDPKKVLDRMASVCGVLLIGFAIGIHRSLSIRLILACNGLLLQIPLLLPILVKKKNARFGESSEKPNAKIFSLSALLLAVLLGLLIPSAVINASPQEFVDLDYYHSPLWLIFSSLCLSCGTCFIWFGVFYWLASEKGKVLFAKIMWCACGIALVDYMFFGTTLGTMSSVLKYDQWYGYSKLQILYNAGIIVILCIVMGTVYRRWKKFVVGALATGAVAMVCMSALNMNIIVKSVANLKEQAEEVSASQPHLTLSKNKQNVVVIMLDRAIGPYVPYIMNEKPELAQKFDGFTYYSNTVSFGGYTNFGTPALFGGYEYTPDNINKRNTETLVSKQNEALKVMPVLFDQNQYKVTVFDAPYANYKWIPDLSIYDDYPNIQKYITEGKFNEEGSQGTAFKKNLRNFFCYSLMKTSPLALQHFQYDHGNYFQPKNLSNAVYDTQTAKSVSVADALDSRFMASYNVLTHLDDMTQVDDTDSNCFFMMDNDTTHSEVLLQEPEYEPKDHVDNTEYDEANDDTRFTVNGRTVDMSSIRQRQHYDVDMCSLIQLGNWFDYLRANDLYDNTRIIVVSDHGADFAQFEELLVENKDGSVKDMEAYAPLLMVKDFNSTGFQTSDEFMTNGDVPTIATSGVIENAVNPFTGNEITNTDKTSHDQYIISSDDWETEKNEGNTFNPADWYSVHDNLWDAKNWHKAGEDSLLPKEKDKENKK
jgi:YidC/Oxa1 family membrane protein insertase